MSVVKADIAGLKSISRVNVVSERENFRCDTVYLAVAVSTDGAVRKTTIDGKIVVVKLI